MTAMSIKELEAIRETLLDEITDKAPEWARKVSVCVFKEGDAGTLVCIVRVIIPGTEPENFKCKEFKGATIGSIEKPRKWLRSFGIGI